MDEIIGRVRDFLASFSQSFKEISVKNIIDIFLVALVLFLGINFVKNRRAGKLILGIFVLGITQVLCEYFDMMTMKYILQIIFQNGLLAIVIIFQPELRSLLEVVGGPLKNLRLTMSEVFVSETEKSIRELCRSAEHLASVKMGALIVLERDTGLDEYIRTGTEIDAKISANLVNNIFFKDASLHDGAMIIRRNRICSAGCRLPASKSVGTKPQFEIGFRHNAAIGISEVSDAVTIVVSEERGQISVTYNGTIVRGFDREKLEKYLLEIFVKSDKRKEKNKKNISVDSCSLVVPCVSCMSAANAPFETTNAHQCTRILEIKIIISVDSC